MSKIHRPNFKGTMDGARVPYTRISTACIFLLLIYIFI